MMEIIVIFTGLSRNKISFDAIDTHGLPALSQDSSMQDFWQRPGAAIDRHREKV
jgi:hypothetical protein